jgi:hypothetical protein
MIMIDNRIALGVAASARLLLLTAGLLGGLSLSTTSSFAEDCQDQPCQDGVIGGGVGGGTGGGGGGGTGGGVAGGGGDGGAGDGGSVVENNGAGSSNSGQTTQVPAAPQATAPTVLQPTAVAPVTVTSSVGETFVLSTRVVVQTSSVAPTLVGSGGDSLISPEASIKAMLPDGMKSSAQTAYRLLGTGSIDLLQIEAAASAYKAFSDLDSVEQQTLFEFMFYGPTSLQDGYLALMKILPSDDPFRARLLEYGAASMAAFQASGNRLWALKRAVTLGYATKIARLSGLSNYRLQELCTMGAEGDIVGQGKCKEAVE